MTDTIVIILAAGKGKRMQSNIPKVLHKLNDKTLIEWVITTSNKITPKKIIIVIGHDREKIRNKLKNYKNLEFAIQENQKGTGHAVKMCFENLKNFKGNVMIVSGDVPLISLDTLINLIKIKTQTDANATILTSNVKDAKGYGRIIRNQNNMLDKIVEDRDCNDDELLVNEINAGVYLFENKYLFDYIPQLNNKNSQGEYYLPDVINLMIENKHLVAIYRTNNAWEIKGINNEQQLIELNQYLNKIERI